MSSTMITIKRIKIKNIKPPINSWDHKEDRKGQPSTIIIKALMKDHKISGFQSPKEKVGAISYMHIPKTSTSRRIQIFYKVPLRIFPLDGQIQGDVVLGTTNGHNLGGSNYLYLFKTHRYYVHFILYDISLRIKNVFLYVHGFHLI